LKLPITPIFVQSKAYLSQYGRYGNSFFVVEELMPLLFVFYTPMVKMQYELGANYIEKPTKGVTDTSAPLPETSTLTVPDNEAIYEENHIPVTANGLIIPHLVLVKTKVILTPEIKLIYGIPKAPAMQDKWCVLEGIIAHKHIYILHIFLLRSGFDYQHSTFTRQVLDLHTYVSYICCAFFTICFGILSLRKSILSKDGHNILHGMLFWVLLPRQTEIDTTIGIQRRYKQEFPTFNALDEVWAVAIPSIYKEMGKSNILFFESVQEFQTQFQLGLEYIEFLTMKLILLNNPFLRHIWSMVNRPVFSGIHIVAGHHHLSSVYFAKRAYPLPAGSVSGVARLGIACIINDYITIFAASGGAVILQYFYSPGVKVTFIPRSISHEMVHRLVVRIYYMFADIPDILPLYFQNQSCAIKSEVSLLRLL